MATQYREEPKQKVDLKNNEVINTSRDIKNPWEQYVRFLNSYQLPGYQVFL